MGELERYGIPQPTERPPQASTPETGRFDASGESSNRGGVPRCTQPCKQLIALFASVERLEDIVFRIQREVAGMECLLAGLENERARR